MSFPSHGVPQDPNKQIEIANLLKRFEDQVEGRAKRAYSQGRVRPDDEGDLACAITTDHVRKRIIMDFGKEVTWLAMTADDAVSWANQLLARAREISDKPIVLEV